MGTLINIEHPGEMPHKVAFHQGLHCLLGQKQSSEAKIHHFRKFEPMTLWADPEGGQGVRIPPDKSQK